MKLSIHKRLRRRDLIRSLGSAALALPFLEFLQQPSYAQQQGQKGATFAIFIYTNDGVFQPRYWPNGGETDFDLMGTILEPFQVGGLDLRDKMLILGPQLNGRNPQDNTGLTYGSPPPQHRAPMCLTASTKNINLSLTKNDPQTNTTPNNYNDGTSSIDQIIAHRIQGDSQFPSLIYAAHPAGFDTVSNVNYWEGTALQRVDSAEEAWNRTFGNFAGPMTPGDPNALAAAQKALAKHSAVTDFLHQRFSSLMPALGVSDKEAIQLHLESLNTLEVRTRNFLQSRVDQGGSDNTCMPPTRREVPTGDAERTGADTEHLIPLFMDLLVGAFACGLTKVGSVSFGYPGGGGEGGLRMPWLGFSDAQHGVSHHNGQAAKQDRYTAMNTWTHLQVAELMRRLAAVPHAEGTMLDHTTIFLYNRHGEGETHSNFALPNLVLGGTGGYFRMGRYTQNGRINPTNLLVSVAHSMGLEDVDSFGKDELQASGPMPGLTA